MQGSLDPPSAGSGMATPVFLLLLLFSMLKNNPVTLLGLLTLAEIVWYNIRKICGDYADEVHLSA